MSARIASLAALAALATLPLWMPGLYYVDVASQILLYAVFALGIDVLNGYAGLVSLGHAGLFGLAAYAAAILLSHGMGHGAAIAGALAICLIGTAIFAALSLRATGIGFVMITLALGEIVWGLAYRWLSLTNGDNGISVASRPRPFGLSLASSPAFYYAALVVFLVSLLACAVFVRSAFGASLMGARDQPRRMTALGYHVWLIRFFACLFSGLLSAIAGLLFLYYNEFVSPQTVDLTASAEVLLMAISGGSGTLLGPVAGAALVVIMKNVVSAYVERWNLVLGAIFVAIVVFMPEGIVPGSIRLARWALRNARPRAVPVAVEPEGP